MRPLHDRNRVLLGPRQQWTGRRWHPYASRSGTDAARRSGRGEVRRRGTRICHGCAVSEAGEVYCWGQLDYDNCGCESAYTPTPAKMELPTTDRFVRIAGGSPATTTCALTEGGEAFCWTPGTVEPTRANVNRALIALSVGINHACGLDKDGTPVCWV